MTDQQSTQYQVQSDFQQLSGFTDEEVRTFEELVATMPPWPDDDTPALLCVDESKGWTKDTVIVESLRAARAWVLVKPEAAYVTGEEGEDDEDA